jgi:hypothetical protein
VLRCYCLFNWDLGYCQGMSDLASPLLVVMQGDEVGHALPSNMIGCATQQQQQQHQQGGYAAIAMAGKHTLVS